MAVVAFHLGEPDPPPRLEGGWLASAHRHPKVGPGVTKTGKEPVRRSAGSPKVVVDFTFGSEHRAKLSCVCLGQVGTSQ